MSATAKTENGKCAEIAYSKGRGGTMWPSTCNRPVKRDGMCGIHANMYDRAKNKD